jgi:hypothetical protein
MSEIGYTSPEFEIDLRLAEIIKRMVEGTASTDERREYQVLCLRRADLMRPGPLGRVHSRRRQVA